MKENKKSRHVMAIAVCLLVIIGILIDMHQQDYWPPFARHQVQADQNSSGDEEPADPNDNKDHGSVKDHDLDNADDDLQDEDTSDHKRTMPVYLVGAIDKPGIYLIEPGLYLYELIEMAGGLTDDAAAEQINLVMQINMNRQIYIPTREEVVNNPQLLPQEHDEQMTGSNGIPLININRATQRELEQLPGIGPVTAKAIIDYREKNGSFSSPEGIMQVTGIKENRFSALKDFIYTD